VTAKVDARTLERLARLGEHLRRLRRALGVSRAKVAKSIGMHPMNYARIEQGKQNVTVEMLLRIADGLGVELVVRFKRPLKRRAPSSRTRRREA
jgi:transcriptional regulator with XRE-family HTH domain